MTLARVFPRKTNQSPDDDKAFFGKPDLFTQWFDLVDISVAFTYDIPKAEELAESWRHYCASVRIGGPAFGKPSGEFIPGKYIKKGITFTSRGCPNKCWFCSVWKREPKLIELEIKPGHIIGDDNLLACSENHIRAVFKMLEGQKERSEFLGGLEAKILKDWHVELFAASRVEKMFFAYDTKDDLDPLIEAGRRLYTHGFTFRRQKLYAYVLAGFPGDTLAEADKRLKETILAGFWPRLMLWKDKDGNEDRSWAKFKHYWCRPGEYAKDAKNLFLTSELAKKYRLE